MSEESKKPVVEEEHKEPVVDITAGIAFFDGFFFRSSSLKYLDDKSVFPIVEEEQIFMCRQMKKSLLKLKNSKKSLSVLDVSTGSGVLGIYAEKVLNKDVNGNNPSCICGLDRSKLAYNLAISNAKDNNCQSIEFRHEEYTTQSVKQKSQDIILMNPPFNPKYPDSEKDFCLKYFKEWISIAVNHIKSDGLIIGCQLSPINRNGEIVAIKELCKILGDEYSVKYLHINKAPHSTKDFLGKQYSSYINLVEINEKESILTWIDNISSAHEKLAFIYFEASQLGGSGKEIIEIEKDENHSKYNESWDRRIFLQRALLESDLDKKADNLISKIDLSKVEGAFQDEGKLSEIVISPLASYIEYKLTFYYGINCLKYLRDYLKAPLFCELVAFCPEDTNTKELLSFSISLESEDKVSAELFFNTYSAFLKFLYDKKHSIFFASDFFYAQHSDQWLPQPNYLTDKNAPLYKEKYLINFSGDLLIDPKGNKSLCAEFIEGNQSKLPNDSVVFEINTNQSKKVYFCNNRGHDIKTEEIYNGENKVHDLLSSMHQSIRNTITFDNETFLACFPIYTRNINSSKQEENYIATGGFLLFGELTKDLSDIEKDDIWRMLRDFALDLKQDLNPTFSGYVYNRSGKRGFYDSLEDITYELQGFWSLINKFSSKEILEQVQDICYLQSTSCEEDNYSIPTRKLDSFVSDYKTLNDLIDYLISTSALFTVGKKSEQLIHDESSLNNEILATIEADIEKVKAKINFIDKDTIGTARIIKSTLFTLSTKLILTALNNTLDKISIFEESQVVTISFENNILRLVNNYYDCSNRTRIKKKNHTRMRLQRLSKFLENSDNLVFNEIKTEDLERGEKEFWTAQSQKLSTNRSEFTSLWLTQVPISLELDS
jgi:methylase of polypeptide subunit release factors